MSDSPAMISAPRLCPKCGAEIPSDAPEAGCPCCLLCVGLLPDAQVAARDASTITAATEKLGELGDYVLLEVVGMGGQGVVYRAHQKSLNRTVALKMISVGAWATEAHLKRFRREAEAAASLEHPAIVPIYEVGEHDGSCYFSMRFVEGGQLDQVIKREPMSVRQAAELISKVARTVHYAHEHGILHRDIKPGNILLDAKGEPLLTDFGLARLTESESTITRTKEIMGTPSYMAPEQAAGNNTAISRTTDVYGLGAVLYQLLTGHPPFAGGTTYETIRLLLNTEPRQPRQLNSKIDRDLSTICLKCLEKDPKRRYSAAAALAEDLEHWLGHEPIRARHTGIFTRGKKWVRRNPTSALLAACLVALAASAGWIVWKSELVRQPVKTGIAVLPFENLGEQKENAVFADGMQDDILTKLAKIADLKVISRTSVMEYRGKRNVPQIGDALRVSHVLEGSVRRTGTQLHMNVQLIDTRTDTHVWAEQYDRDLDHVFAIQTEIVKAVADQLQANLSPKEKVAIEQRPTQDLAAYDLYLRAKELIYDSEFDDSRRRENHFKAVQLLDQTIARDPAFLLAHCQLAYVHDQIYLYNFDHTETRLALAETSVKAAVRLEPDSGETHLAQASHFYWGYLNYDRAREELAKAQRALPNNTRIFRILGFIDRRQGRWDEAVRNLERAEHLDPRNVITIYERGLTYSWLRKYKEAIAMFNRALPLEPRSIKLRTSPGRLVVLAQGDTAPLRAVVNTIEAEGPSSAAEVATDSFELAVSERDPAAAAHALANIPSEGNVRGLVEFPHAWYEGRVSKLRQDASGAHSAFTVARAEVEKTVRAQPGNVTSLGVLALIDAELGDKEKAIQEGRAACDMLPPTKDAVVGVFLLTDLARIYALTGEKDLALQQLEIVSKLPAGPTYGGLRLDPRWDALRGDPRFEQIVASLAPKEK